MVLLFSFASLTLYLYTKRWWTILLIPFGFMVSYVFYTFFKEKEEEEMHKKMEEWERFFIDLSHLSSFSKENILKREIPLSFRLLLERSLSVNITLDDYKEIGKDLPFTYQCIIESLYFYETYQSQEEWQFAYEQFLKEKEENEEKKEQKKISFYRQLPLVISFIFASILFVFTVIS